MPFITPRLMNEEASWNNAYRQFSTYRISAYEMLYAILPRGFEPSINDCSSLYNLRDANRPMVFEMLAIAHSIQIKRCEKTKNELEAYYGESLFYPPIDVRMTSSHIENLFHECHEPHTMKAYSRFIRAIYGKSLPSTYHEEFKEKLKTLMEISMVRGKVERNMVEAILIHIEFYAFHGTTYAYSNPNKITLYEKSGDPIEDAITAYLNGDTPSNIVWNVLFDENFSDTNGILDKDDEDMVEFKNGLLDRLQILKSAP